MKAKTLYNFSIKNNGTATCDVFIDGEIVSESTRAMYESFFGDKSSVSYASMRTTVDGHIASGCTTINLFINTLGGDVIEAMATHDYFVSVEAKGITVNRIGRGLVASAGTYLLCSDSETSITKSSFFMIHNVAGGIQGSVQEVEAYARTLRTFNDSIANFYANITGISLEEINTMMTEETWLTAEQAVQMGFVSKLVEDTATVATNSIDPIRWTFNNKEVLTAYNKFSNKHNMENTTIASIVNGVREAFMNTLIKAKLIPAEGSEMATTLTNALNDALLPMNAGITAMVDEVMETKMTELTSTITNMITTEVAKISIPDNTADVTAIENRLTEIEQAITDNAGSAGSEKEKQKKPEVVTALTHAGIGWGREPQDA